MPSAGSPANDQSVLLEIAARAEARESYRRCPENLAMPSVMRALMDFLGEDLGHAGLEAHGSAWRRDLAYTYFAGTSGEAFRFVWAPAPQGDGLTTTDAPCDPVLGCAHAFAASGYEHDIVLHAGFAARLAKGAYACAGHERLRSQLVRTISSGRPVVAAGITGTCDVCLLTGFGDRGDIVLGWSISPGGDPGILFEPDRRLRFDDWYPTTNWMVFVGEKREQAPVPGARAAALKRAVGDLTTSLSGSCIVGPAAFESWARALRDVSQYAGGDPSGLHGRRAVTYPSIWQLAERRWYGARFIEDALPELSAHETALRAAMGIFDEEHDLMWRIDALVRGGSEDEADHLRNLADPGIRRQAADIVDACRDKDAEAADLLSSLAAD